MWPIQTVMEHLDGKADSLPTDPSETIDTDNDGFGNNADTDDDSDSIVDESDKCPLVYDPEQLDSDGDGIGDACDEDGDSDGVLDIVDSCLATSLGEGVNAEGCSCSQLNPPLLVRTAPLIAATAAIWKTTLMMEWISA